MFSHRVATGNGARNARVGQALRLEDGTFYDLGTILSVRHPLVMLWQGGDSEIDIEFVSTPPLILWMRYFLEDSWC